VVGPSTLNSHNEAMFRRLYRWFAGVQIHQGRTRESRRVAASTVLSLLDRGCGKIAVGIQYVLMATLVGMPVAGFIIDHEPLGGRKGWLNLLWALTVVVGLLTLLTVIVALYEHLPPPSGGGGSGDYMDDICWDSPGGAYRC